MQDDRPPPDGPSGFFIAVTIVGIMAVSFALLFRAAMAPVVSSQVGKQFPPIEAGGWINGPEPKELDFQGKILVVAGSWFRKIQIQIPVQYKINLKHCCVALFNWGKKFS